MAELKATGATVIAETKIAYGGSKLVLRHMSQQEGDEVTCALPPDDSYVVILQLRDLPDHEYWVAGKHFRQGSAGSSAINIFDLSDEPSCRILARNDNLHLQVPKLSLVELCEEIGAPPVAHLRTDLAWEMHDGVVGGLKQAIASSLQHRCTGSTLFMDHAVLALHSHLARVYGGLRPGSRCRVGGLAPWQERTAKELLAADLDRELTLAEVALACKLSPSHFARAFKASVSATPHGFRQARRIERAKDLLTRSDLTLAQIALACGFSDQSHFTRVFASSTGFPPGIWRRNRVA